MGRLAAARGIRILLTEGSSLSAREAITALGMAGYRVSICDPRQLCMGRFSRFVDRLHTCPPVSRSPEGYIDCIAGLIKEHRYNVVIPVHEQAYLLANQRAALPPVHLALAPAASFDRVQSKVALTRTLRELSLPQPVTRIAICAAQLMEAADFPYYVKPAFGTASSGIVRVENADQRDALAEKLDALGLFVDGVVIQQLAIGRLERVQAVFQYGRLVGVHAYRQVRESIRGGDVVKESVHRGIVREQVAGLGRFLDWHGALSLDYFWSDERKAQYIDANPRLVEPMNAALSGANLPELLVRVSLDETCEKLIEGAAGVRTRLTLMGVLTQASRSPSRLGILGELARAILGRDEYANTVEELTPVQIDPRSLIPLSFVVGCALISPKLAPNLASGSVDAYAIAGRTGFSSGHRALTGPPDERDVLKIPAA